MVYQLNDYRLIYMTKMLQNSFSYYYNIILNYEHRSIACFKQREMILFIY